MLVSGKSNVQPPRWIRRRGTAAAVCMLPLGMVYCGFADQPMPTAPEDAAELVTLSEEPAGKQPTELVFTYDMTSNSNPDVRRLVYDGSRGCRWIVEPNGVCDDYWQKWYERLKKARAEPGGMRVLHIPSEATAGWVWRLQETILANP